MTRTNARQQEVSLRDEIDQTRAELGETVQALAERMDVPTRMRAVSARAGERARRSAAPWVVAGGVAGLAATAVVLLLRRSRR